MSDRRQQEIPKPTLKQLAKKMGFELYPPRHDVNKWIFPRIRTFQHGLAAIEPMPGPLGQVFYIDFRCAR